MNLLWRDDFGSFLASSVTGAGSDPLSLSSADLGTPWFEPADSGLLSGPSLLWWEHATAGSPGGNPDSLPVGGWIPTQPNELQDGTSLTGGLLWSDNGSGASSLLPGTAGAGQPDWSAALFAADISNSQWQQFSAGLAPSASPTWTWMNDVSNLVWTGGPGGIGGPPFAPPASDNPPVHLTGVGGLPDSTASTLGAQHLVWIDPSTGAPTLFNDQSTAVLMPFPLASHP